MRGQKIDGKTRLKKRKEINFFTVKLSFFSSSVDCFSITVKLTTERSAEGRFPDAEVFRDVSVDAGSIVAPALLDAGLDPFLVLPPVLLEELGGHRVGRRVGVGVAQQRLDRRQDGGNVVRRTPPGIVSRVIDQNVEASS